MTTRTDDTLLIGVDGGATSVRAHEVIVEHDPDGPRFSLGPASAHRDYPPSSFDPIPTKTQHEQHAAARIDPTPQERDRGKTIAETMVDCIADVARNAAQRSPGPLCLGLGMPGLKTADHRGIAVMNNGPRIPNLLDQLEVALREKGVKLFYPIRRVGSDADYAGLGERFAADGSFRNIDHAYYLGGGTGLAEALLLNGELLPFDSVRTWIAKAWEIRSIQGSTFEQLASASAINRRYNHYHRRNVQTLSEPAPSNSEPHNPPEGQFPEQRAKEGDSAAVHILESAADALSELIYERIVCVYRGRQVRDHRGPDYANLDPHHEFRGLRLERIVLGQQIGRIYADPQFAAVFSHKLDRFLADRIRADHDTALHTRYLNNKTLHSRTITTSRLTAAPALGAAIDAEQHLTGRGKM